MEWLLVVFGFDLVDGSPRPNAIFHKAYASEQARDEGGRAFRSIIKRPPEEKSISICIPRDWFEAQGWRTEELG